MHTSSKHHFGIVGTSYRDATGRCTETPWLNITVELPGSFKWVPEQDAQLEQLFQEIRELVGAGSTVDVTVGEYVIGKLFRELTGQVMRKLKDADNVMRDGFYSEQGVLEQCKKLSRLLLINGAVALLTLGAVLCRLFQ